MIQFGRSDLLAMPLVLVIFAVTAWNNETHAQSENFSLSATPPDPGLELLQQEPHDLIFFTADSGGGWVKAVPLDIPGRRLPAEMQACWNFRSLVWKARIS